MGMETLTANIAGKTRRVTRNGREYVVAPMTLIVPGVLNGSQGPLFYPEEEITKNAAAWNGMPLVVGHPYDSEGNPISARSPDILDAQGVGEVFNAIVSRQFHGKSDTKLVAEGWFDVERTRKVDASILSSLEAGNLLELSTGLFTDNKPAPAGSVHKDRPYSFIASNYRPDHLAILMDSKGACSIADGCGVNVNQEGSTIVDKLPPLEKTKGMPFGFRWDKVFIGNEVKFRITPYTSPTMLRSINNQAVFVGFVGRTNKHVHQVTLNSAGDGIAHLTNGHIHQIKNFKVATNEGHTHALRRESLTNSGSVSTNKNIKKKDSTMNETKKKEIIDNLIANVCCWEEGERELLEGFSDAKLEGMHKIAEEGKRHEILANAAKKGITDPGGNTHTWNEKTNEWDMKEPDKKKKEVTVNTEKPLTEEQWLEKAPAGVREQLSFAQNEMRKQKTSLVERLTANVKDEQEQAKLSERFMAKSLEDLQDMAAILPEPVKTVANYGGAATPEQVTANAQKNFAPFGLPHEYIEDEKE